MTPYKERMRAAAATLLLLLTASTATADLKSTKDAVVNEVKRDARDAASMATQPLRWKAQQWARFGEGLAGVLVLYAADQKLDERVQANRTSSTDDFAKFITPFGGNRALQMAAALVIGGAASNNVRVRDAGRDSLEAELWAAGVVTPLLKRTFGRARPNQNLGAREFEPGAHSGGFESFPSGHATNAFAFATAVAGHYDNWVVPTIVYTMATGVAMSRVNDRAHFASDVLGGALIGHAIGKSVVARHRKSQVQLSVAPRSVQMRIRW